MIRRLSAFTLLLACGLAPLALAGDAFDPIEDRYEELAGNRDDDGNRARRDLYLEMFDHLQDKSCRKLLKEAYEDEVSADNRIRVVEVLGACGQEHDLKWLVGEFKREKSRGAVLVLGQALGYTDLDDPDRVEEAVSFAAKQLKRAKGDLRVALLEGLGNLRDRAAFELLLELGDEGTVQERFERAVALGKTGGDDAVAPLLKLLGMSDPDVHLGAAIGLAETRSDAAVEPLVSVLDDPDPRVIEVAADALRDRGHTAAAPALVEAMRGSPVRTVETVRQALVSLTEQDHGHDVEAWAAAVGEGKAAKRGKAPEFPEFWGIPVASDRVVIFLDLSSSMDRMGRMREQLDGVSDFLRALPDHVEFALYRVQTSPERFRDDWASAGADREAAIEWVQETLSGGRYDMRAALLDALDQFPTGDTFLLATDSYPWGRGTVRSPRETMEIFRSVNRIRRVRVHAAYLTPGGVDDTSLRDAQEYEDRKVYLDILTAAADGETVHVE